MVASRIHPDLPIFRLSAGGEELLYTPGHLAVVPGTEADALARGWERRPSDGRPAGSPLGPRLEHLAGDRLARWRRHLGRPFAPECLTVVLTDRCPLACPYCFSAGARRAERGAAAGRAGPGRRAIAAAARLVARSCRARGLERFQLVAHGGGEPTVAWRGLQELVRATRAEARRHGLDWSGYVATNGVLPEARARWLARTFDRIGLSCDGPPDVQNRQRPTAGGGPSSGAVERTARVLAGGAGRLQVRATITRATAGRQAELVGYFHRALGAREMRFEPVYLAGELPDLAFAPEDAESFVESFLEAQRRARDLGCVLELAGSRPDELHGPFCNPLRDVLQLFPDGTVGACFLGPDGSGGDTLIGRWDEEAGEVRLDADRIADIRRLTWAIPPACHDCPAALHCARGCPEVCPLRRQASDAPGAAGFRCRVQRLLVEAWLIEAAAPLLTGRSRERDRWPAARSRDPEEERVVALLSELAVDPEPILAQWRAVRGRLAIERATLPLPVWAVRGFEETGPEAWQRLSHEEVPDRPGDGPVSIYVHVPFCDRRCGFCNSYSTVLGERGRHREERYVRALAAEIDAWAAVEPLGRRPVATVHFGGGTANCLEADRFAALLAACRERFRVGPETEWAVESTSALLTKEHLDQLLAWGFRRLHVGVQTLEDPVRRAIGRRDPAPLVVEKLRRALAAGFVTSVDVMYALPGQSAAGLVATLETLADAGLHGVSVYGLQVTHRNRRFLERHGAARRDPLREYLWFQAAEQLLRRRGYRKTHFTHFALPPDSNLYYSHPERGEDLLALGATADGAFGGYHYRHPELQPYLTGTTPAGPALEGGVSETPSERLLHPVATELMAGAVRPETLERLGAAPLLARWREWALVAGDTAAGRLTLTANGSWFVADMLRQAAASPAAAAANRT
jgi:oxygen-independent coproporphyrinogen-3 oxidase